MRFNLRIRPPCEMNTSVLNALPPMGFSIANVQPAPAAGRSAPVLWRRQSMVRVIMTLSWVVGITACFLAVGVIGLFASDLPPIHLRELESDSADNAAMIETSMAELQSMDSSEEAAAEQEESVLPVEIPEEITTPPENLDLPELAEALTMEDVFAIPTAPKIENALKPVDPVVRPRPAPAPPRTQKTASHSNTSSSSSRAGSASGATGGTGSGVGTGRGKFPSPPYPGFARSGGMQGTVRLSINVGPSGAVESVNVMSSTGYSSLDEYAASWVRRNWRWPGGTANRYSLPLTFRLR